MTELRGRADELLARDASYIENHRDRIEADLLGARYAIGTGSPQQATTMAVAAVSRAADVIAMNPHDDLSKRYYLRATELLSRSRWLGGDESGARQAAQAAVDLIGEEPIEDPSAARLLDRLVLAAAGGSPRELNRGNHGCDDRSDNLVPPFDTANSER